MHYCRFCKQHFEKTKPNKEYCSRDCKERARKKRMANKEAARVLARKEHRGEFNCELCGYPAEHRHHEDYENPLEIIWLCQKCHSTVHAVKKLLANRCAKIIDKKFSEIL